MGIQSIGFGAWLVLGNCDMDEAWDGRIFFGKEMRREGKG
jgi:hypothetical protein